MTRAWTKASVAFRVRNGCFILPESAGGDVSSKGQLVIQCCPIVPCRQATNTTEFSIMIESSWMGEAFPGIKKVQSCPDLTLRDRKKPSDRIR
jgi:hypothetical protein